MLTLNNMKASWGINCHGEKHSFLKIAVQIGVEPLKHYKFDDQIRQMKLCGTPVVSNHAVLRFGRTTANRDSQDRIS